MYGKGHGFCFRAWNSYNGCQNDGLADNLPDIQILSIIALLEENAIRNGTFSLQDAKAICLNNRHPTSVIVCNNVWKS